MSDDQAFRDFLLADKSASRNADPALVPGRVNARVGVTAQPDAQAQFGDLAKRYGVPAAVVENDPEVWKQRAAADEAQQHIDASPKLGQWLGEDPQRAKVSHDSLEAMAGVDHAFSAVFPKNGSDADKLRYWKEHNPGQGSITTPPSTAQVVVAKIRKAMDSLYSGTQSSDVGLYGIAANAMGNLFGDNSAIAQHLRQRAGEKQREAQKYSQANKGGEWEQAIYGGIESLPQALVALGAGVASGGSGSVVVGTAGSLLTAGATVQGQSYITARQAGLSHEEAQAFGQRDAAVEVATELLPTARIFHALKVGTPAMDKLKDWAVAAIEEQVGEQFATHLQDLNQWASIDANKGKTLDQYFAERPDAAFRTAVATAIMSGTIGGIIGATNLAQRRRAPAEQQAQRSQRTEALLTGLKELAEAAPIAKRDVSTFENWVKAAADGTQATDVYIDARTLVETLQQSGLTEPEIVAALPSIRTELPTALLANGDVRIPIEEFAARSGELGQSLIQHLRIDPNDMSTSEAQTFMQSAQDEFQKETEKAFAEINADDQFRQSTERVADAVYEKLNQAGRFTPDTNRAYASLHAAFFARLASDLGTTPEEAAARYPLLIQSEGVGEGPGVMDQPNPQTETPEFKAWFGDSKVVDEQGRPLVVYHGTAADFDIFKNSPSTRHGHGRQMPGIYLTPDPSIAEAYARTAANARDASTEINGAAILPLFVKMENPARFADPEDFANANVVEIKKHGYDGAVRFAPNDGRLLEIVVFDPTQIKSIHNRGTFDPNDPRILYQNGQPIFYSALQRTVESSKQAKAPASQWKSILQNAPGVKAEELEWSGILDLFDEDPKRVWTRDELVQLLDAGGIKVDEVVLGDEPKVSESEIDELAQLKYDEYVNELIDEGFDEEDARDQGNGEWGRFVDQAERELQYDAEDTTAQFKDWSSDPNNDTYRELLITLPIGEGRNPDRAPSTHWDQPNVVAHARFMDKRDASGDRVLFIEEVQSDWHQKGRDQGYAAPPNPEAAKAAQAKYDEARARWFRTANDVFEAYRAEGRTLPEGWDSSSYADVAFALNEVRNTSAGEQVVAALVSNHQARLDQDLAGRELDIAKGLIREGIPNAPFKSSWPALVMKRMIRWAVDNGYTKIAWTTGAEQTERYDLGQATGALDHKGRDGDAYLVEMNALAAGTLAENGMGEQTNDYGGGRMTLRMTENQMREAFGNDVSARFMALPEGAALPEYDLKIGGEGMKAFYDRNLVNITNDLIKKHGVKVSGVAIGEAANQTAWRKARNARYAEIRAALGPSESPTGVWSVAEVDRRLAVLAPDKVAENTNKLREEHLRNIEQLTEAINNPDAPNRVEAAVPAYRDALMKRQEKLDALDADIASGARDARLAERRAELEAARAELLTIEAEQQPPADATHRGFEISDKLAEAAAGGFPLFQGPRGQIRVGDVTQDPTVITLLQRADLSTFLHESGHFFFEVLMHVAAQPDAPQRVVDDMNAFLKWTGVESMGQWSKMTTNEKREHHERFARGFEAFLYEGNAPSLELKSLFQRFRDWLLTVYRSLTQLNVELNPEVRGIFNRMLASDQAIREAEQQVGYEPILTEKPVGMADEEWEAYQRLGAEATSEAVTDLERRSLRDMRYAGKAAGRELKRLQREIRTMRETMRAEVEADLAREPVYRAQEFMKKGLLDGEPIEGPSKMLLSEVEALYEDRPKLYVDEVKRALGFGQYGMLAKDGIHPEQIAELFGFTSADHMIQDLMLAEPFKKAVETEIDTRMLERYGDITSEKALQDAVDQAIHNDVRGRFVATEFAALSKAPGKPRVMAAAARSLAEKAVSRLKVRNLRPAQYEAAERRAAKAAAEASAKGDIPLAASEKRNQLINFYGAKASRDALTEIDRIVRYFKKFDAAGTRKNLDTGYLDQIDKLLERFDLRKSVTNRQADKRKSLVAWVERQKEQGFDPLIDEELLDEANRTPYRELTVEEMRGLRDAVKNIEHLARLKKKLLTAKDKREFADAVNDVASAIRENAYQRVEEIIGSKSWWEQVKAGVADFLAMHRKMANWAYVMDGNKTGGAVWERFIRPMNERGNFEAARRAQATKDLGALFDRLKGQNLNKRTFVPAIGKSLSLQDRLMVALNLGNEGNMQRVMDGERWEQDKLNAVLEPLTAEHWTFVQAVWDYLDSFYPEVAAKEIRVSGVAPQKVEARPFERQLADGTTVSLRGGYFPIKYDTARSSRAEADTAAEVLQQMTQGKYTSAQTRRGHTKARAEQVDRPVRKDFGVIFEHVNQVIHDLAWHEYLIDANRLLRAVEIDGAIREAHGPQVLKWLRKALEDIALGDIPSQNAFESVINYVRAGASIAAMGWNLWTSMMQPLGLTQSASRIGTKWVAKGLGRVIGDAAHIESTARWVYDRSEFMRTRALTQQREIAEIRNKVGDKSPLRKTVELAVPAGVVDAVEDSYFILIAKAQMIADLPTWIGQYEKSMEAGETEERAADLADQAVLDSQGGGQIKDLSGIQRGNALMKLWTNFYSYFNTTYNLMADRTAQLRRVGPSDLPAFAVDQLMLTALPSVLTTLLYQLVKGDDDDWDKVPSKMASDLFGYLTGLMVGLREVGAVLNPDSSYAGPAGARVFSEINKFGKQVQQGEADEALARSANQLAGILFHYPAGQVDRTARGLYAMEQGEAGPLAPVVGPPPKQ